MRACPPLDLDCGVRYNAGDCHIIPQRRHCFAIVLRSACSTLNGIAIRTVQELLGHKDVSTTMIYTHVLNRGVRGVRSPLDDPMRRPDTLDPRDGPPPTDTENITVRPAAPRPPSAKPVGEPR